MESGGRKKKLSRRRRHSRRQRTVEEDVTVDCDDSRIRDPTGKDGKELKEPKAEKKKPRKKAGRAISHDVANSLAEFVKETKELGLDGMRKEYESIRGFQPSNTDHNVWKSHTDKNRYQDVPCLDASRVVLTLNAPPETDYIHANCIKMDGNDKSYIATQGPLEGTICDFWRMIYQETINTIIMLCKTVEDTKAKCALYWPEEAGANKTYGSMFIMNKKTEHEDKFETYVLEVLPEGCSNSIVVKLIQMTDWPDRGVPQSGFTVLRLLRMIPLGTSTVVHCSAGVGRTGTVVAIDTILARLWKSQKVKVVEVVKEMRKSRLMMVQSEAQYVFIYCTILDYIQAKQPGKYREFVHSFHNDVENAEMV